MFTELFQHIQQAYGIELNEVQKMIIEKVLISRREFMRLPDNHRIFFNALPEHDFTTEKALLIGKRKGLSRATIFRVLNNDILFLKLSHGLYQRLF